MRLGEETMKVSSVMVTDTLPAELLGEHEGVRAGERIVHPPPEGEVEDNVVVPAHVDVALDGQLLVVGDEVAGGLLLPEVRQDGAGGAVIDAEGAQPLR